MDMLRLYQDYGVLYFTEGKNTAAGWISTRCVWCDDQSNHLSWNLDDGYFSCWRCGAKKTIPTVARLLGIGEIDAEGVIKIYGGVSKRKLIYPEKEIFRQDHKLPGGTGKLQANHKKYLSGRGFDPDQLEYDWGLLGTGPIALLSTGQGNEKKTIDFRYRVIAPIIWNKEEVSFQGRDITGKSGLRYITCPPDREVVHHKHILGGRQEFWGDTGIIVEGYYDVLRFGLKACCTFGTKYTTQQVRTMVRSFKRAFVIFDDEPQAQEQAQKLVAALTFRNVPAEKITIAGDPGAMKQDDADYLVKQLIK